MTEKTRKTYGFVKKAWIMFLLMMAVLVSAMAVQGTGYLIKRGAYHTSSEELTEKFMNTKMKDVARETLRRHVLEGISGAIQYANESHCGYVVESEKGWPSGTAPREYVWSKQYRFNEYVDGKYLFARAYNYSITLYLREWGIDTWVLRNSDWLRIVWPVIIIPGIIGVSWCAIILIRKIGWTPEAQTVTAGRFGKIPGDLFTLLCFFWGCVWVISCKNILNNLPRLKDALVFYGLFLLISIWLLSIIARIKAKKLFDNLFVKKLGFKIESSWKKLSFAWKMLAVLLGYCLAEGIILLVCVKFWERDAARGVLVSLWLVEKLVLIPLVIVVVQQLATLKTAGKALAEGKTDYKVDEGAFRGALKEHAHHLNSISDGIELAVQERMKSERFKTELITNVSHDIKTPLTSIINYSDLLCKEETDNEKIKEYAQVLHRQSGRLKKLVDDLMEASKASTGSLDVQMEECQVSVLLQQAVGEFEGRLFEKKIDVISKVPEEPVKIMADGKLLWRVFENLLNNICKYTQEGTRVYLSTEKDKNAAEVTFKNISEYPLDITEEELMERFVRGDKSRHTEGNGLGLNIAKSLVELQKGTMKIVIDGDLFKVILRFPTIE